MMRIKFPTWQQLNFQAHPAGRIVVLWDPSKVCIEQMEVSPQAIHCAVTCKVTTVFFTVSFVYALHSIVSRRPLWYDLVDFGQRLNSPWLVVGDFNSVLSPDERCNGVPVSAYESKDLQDYCLAVGLSDLPYMGCYFTWTNNSVWSKLDRALVNNQSLMAGMFGQAFFPPSGCLSDHSPCIVSLINQDVSFRKPFKFFDMWTLHENFEAVVNAEWSSFDRGSMQFVMCNKMRRLKGPLKNLNAQHFSHISDWAGSANEALKVAQLELHNNPHDSVPQNRVVGLRKATMNLSEAERQFFSQKVKCAYLQNSDRCTKFFHALVKRNAKRNQIVTVKKEDGSFTCSQSEVANKFVRYFSKLLGTESQYDPLDPGILCSGKLVSVKQAAALIRPMSQEEIKAALFSIGESKAPGPDGYTSGFFKKAWPTVGDLCCKAVQEFFILSMLLKQLNHIAVSLIPKSSHAQDMGDFRPIACCNVMYKVISKVLASRLVPILGHIIDNAQSAFVEGRNMIDNIHLSQELLRNYSKRRVSPRCLVKVDLKKALIRSAGTFLGMCFAAWPFLLFLLIG